MIKKKVLILISILFSISNIFSQIIAPDKRISQYTHTIYRADDGVKDVLAMTQDESGYIWIASYEGLLRYDGNHFKIYNSANRDDFPANSIRSLNTDISGNLWIGTNDHGVAILNDNKFTMYDITDGLPNNSVRTIYTDSQNRTWIGTAAGLAVYIDGVFITFPEYDDLNSLQTQFVTENHNGEIIIGTSNNNSIYIYRNKKMSPYAIFDNIIDHKIEYIIQDKFSRDFWAITSSTLYRIDSGKIEVEYDINMYHENPQKLVMHTLYLDRSNTLWILSDGGLAKLHHEKFSFYFNSDGLSDNLVKCAFHDQEGTFWVGTRMGLDKFVEPKFSVFNNKDGLVNDAVNAVLQIDKDKIWIGTNQGISEYSKDSNKIIKSTLLADIDLRIRHLYKDSKERVWISCYGEGAALFENGAITKWYTTENGLAGNKVRTIIEDSDNNIWIGTTSGLSKISEGTVTTYKSDDGMSFEYVMCLYEGADGKLWIGTDGGGILFFENGEFTSVLSTENGLAGNVVFRVFKDSLGVIWVTTGNGISRLKNGEIRNYSMSSGLLTNSVFQILEDKDGKLWLTSSKGIFSVDRGDFDGEKLNLEIYNSLNGLPGVATSTAWAIKDSRDNLWFPTYKGIAVLNPNSISTNRIPPKIAIDNEVIIDNVKRLQYNSTILEPNTKRIKFTFASLSFQIPENVYTQYKLEGFDNEWSPLSNQREAIYTNLSPGHYSFKVRGYNNDGIISENDATFNFTKKPHFYERILFIIFIFVFSLTIIILIVFKINSLRLERLRKELDLERKAKEAEHLARIKEMELTKSYSRFVPHEFLDLLNKDIIQNVKLGDQIEKKMSIFVTDIRGFTSISEKMTPNENINFLNDYLSKIVPIIRKRGGLIDKYMGDGVMALFPENPLEAVKTAIEFQKVLRDFNIIRVKKGFPPVYSGIAIHTGSLMLGILGEQNRMDATVISDAVNLTFRLESLTKHYKCGIIISEQVKVLLDEEYTTRYLSTVQVKGKSNPVQIYEILDSESVEVKKIKIKSLERYNFALKLFFDKKFSDAVIEFKSLSELSKEDELYKIYIQRCNELLVCDTLDNWDEVIRL